MKVRLCILVLLIGTTAWAQPDLSHYRDIEKVRLYRDHKKVSLWYLTPPSPAIARRADKTPAYNLALYRYLGRKGTGDTGAFWTKALLTVGIDRPRAANITSRIRKALRRSGVQSPRLRSMPVTATSVKLNFADQQQSWQQGVRWQGGGLVLALTPHLAQILWQAAAAGQTQVHLVIEETLAGVRLIDKQWQAEQTAQSWTIAVTLDMQQFPGHFQKTDLGGRMVRGYTGIDVFCFDFVEGLDADLYAKIVQIAIPTAGRDLVETITFKDTGDYRGRIEFKLAKDLNQPYRVRITQVYKDGQQTVGPWQQRQGEAMLDVTAYREDEEER